ncbi:hypothetical protein [Halorussus halophilus]|uniref:hypothetical protein n=1 Tax=Halorussus halophilus TaxID=2650975 RepID=UPI0017888461|nr:hypothetical protein [Halorussus halophilus]
MLPKSQKDRANWRSSCPKDGSSCGEIFHLTKADAVGRNRAHKHEIDIERVNEE